MFNLNGLDQFVVNPDKPSDIEFLYYLFWDKGIGLEKVVEYPLPYLFSILKAHNYVKKEEEKAYKKANKRNK